MTQKLIVGLLVLTVVGAAALGIYDATRSDEPVGATELLASDTNPAPAAALAATATPVTDTIDAVSAVTDPTAAQDTPVQQQSALDQVGDPWQASGVIAGFDTNGMFLTSSAAGDVYVELGPANFWQAQPVTLAVGEIVRVDGFFNGDQIHAATVTKADGSTLELRTAEGLPLWSGGAQNGNANGNGNAGQGEPLVAPDEWVTVAGTVTDYTGNALTIQTSDGKTLTFQPGQPRFIEEQGITFAPGDAVRVLGFWQMDQFKAGEITKTATGERLMLLDPNGRPLWGGPGRSGEQSGGQGNQGQGNQGQSGQGGGNGNGYQGGRNQDSAE